MDEETEDGLITYTFDDDCECAAECAEINVTEVAETESSWSQTSICYLLEECLKRKKDLHDPRHRRNKFFAVIRENMMARGCYFSANTLQKKFHNLKKHFCTICQNRDRAVNPGKPITWPYYSLMMEIFAEELEIEDAPTMASLYPDPLPPKTIVLVKQTNVKAAAEYESRSETDEVEPAVDDGTDADQDSPWTHKAVVAFLRECEKKKHELWNPQIRRRAVFSDVRLRLKAKGYSFSPDSLDRKLRNMKSHFQTVTDQAPKNGDVNHKRRRLTWPYHDLMNDIYGPEAEEEVYQRRKDLILKKKEENLKEREEKLSRKEQSAKNRKEKQKPTITIVPTENLTIPKSSLKFRPIAPKTEMPANTQPVIAQSAQGQNIQLIFVPQIAQVFSAATHKVECPANRSSSPGEFDGNHQQDDYSGLITTSPITFENSAKDVNPDFEVTMHRDDKPKYVGDKFKFSMDILALEERRTVVSEQMLDELVESNKIKQKLLQFKRAKLELAMARAKRKNDYSV